MPRNSINAIMLKQRTLKTSVTTTGVGVHTGKKVNLTLRPAQVDTGIIFRRVDELTPVEIPAQADRVSDTRLCSTVEHQGSKVATVEHLMSALAGLGIDNLYIEVQGPEIPILDGSAAPFVFLLQSAGIEEQNAAKRYICIKQSIEVRQADKWARLDPHEGFRVDFTVDFPHPLFGSDNRRVIIDFAQHSFIKEVSRARTFAFMQEVEQLRAQGLAQGGNLGNAVVLDEYRVLNNEGLRYEDELARHKVLDAIGDLYLLGHSLIGSFSAYKSGHSLNNQLCRALLHKPEAWQLVSFNEPREVPQAFLDWRLQPTGPEF